MNLIYIIRTLTLGVALSAGLPFARAAQNAEPITQIDSLQSAINRGDVEAALGLYRDDSRVTGGPQCTPVNPCIGRDQVRARFLEAIVAQRLQIRTLATQGTHETMTIRNELRSDLFRERGFERLIAWTEFQLREGLIASQSIQFDLTDPASAAYFAKWGPPARPKAQ